LANPVKTQPCGNSCANWNSPPGVSNRSFNYARICCTVIPVADLRPVFWAAATQLVPSGTVQMNRSQDAWVTQNWQFVLAFRRRITYFELKITLHVGQA
jgi:hypothetical protein